MVLEDLAAKYLTDYFKKFNNISLKNYTRRFVKEKGRKRKRIQALLYGVITYLFTIDRALNDLYGDKTKRVSDIMLNTMRVYAYRKLYQGFLPSKAKKNVILRKIESISFPEPVDEIDEISISTSFQRWVVERLIKIFPKTVLLHYLNSLNVRKPIWIIINPEIKDIKKVVVTLDIEGIEMEKDNEFEIVYKVISMRKPIDKTEPFKKNEIIVMNKASAAVVFALNPKEGDTVIDTCAAPGMKTILTSLMMLKKGNIYAYDNSEKRLEKMKKLLSVYNVRNVALTKADSRMVEFPNEGKKILIDAPCSSSGMIMDSPDIKLRLSPKRVSEYSTLQWEILNNVLNQFQNKKVEIVYSTCSIFPEEGEKIVRKLLDQHSNVKLENLSFGNESYSGDHVGRRYYPHIHDTIGMFITKLKMV